MRLRSLDEFCAALDQCTSHRRHELKNLSAAFLTRRTAEQSIQKAALLLCYAHWEGGVKQIATTYLDFVAQQHRYRRELKSNFLALESMAAIRMAANSESMVLYIQAVDHIRFHLDHRLQYPRVQLIDTANNLSSKVLQNILRTIGLPDVWQEFEIKKQFIDVALLKNRNAIAHNGQTDDRTDVDARPIIEETLNLLGIFRNAVENAAALRSYLLQP